ncbi:alpha subunit of ribonucleoside diphosphate reductase [Lentinus tigrinus ALCF2SS1-7]|uniref:Ribonucleoside-diphosphate reductase n=1 Tax=Lentinus tigrinus ALCF2SS1-6 TaxID=1328759 RepID=A0A5C2SMA2_9APHY|nr:alpha subunit of ribonucleoside diphosphate reductase [Lentinus tigrinus ALCF2SS1-6]RPD76628.1 alpha subunit of ribonucleoside diphosphate reductase [Lentinus tigrinus ALCF2SS1-7]
MTSPDVVRTVVLKRDGVVSNITSGLALQVSSTELQLHAATTLAAASTKHPDFSKLAGRLFAASLHKNTPARTFSAWVAMWANHPNSPFHPSFIDSALSAGPDLDEAIVHTRDFDFTYSSLRVMAHTYLLRVDGRIIERPQFLYMRVAVATYGTDTGKTIQLYNALSRHLFTPASPVLFNAGTRSQHYASCFLYTPDNSSPSGQLESTRDLDSLWLADGGIGLSLADVPPKKQRPSPQPGILPLLRIYDAHAEYTSLHRQKRPSAATIHLPIWHAEVRPFLACRTTQAYRHRVRHLYPSLWIPDIFRSMCRLRDHQDWTLFDPATVPLLLSTHGEQFTHAYETYEDTVDAAERVSAVDLWTAICRAQQETGTLFLMYQDSINAKNNHSHLGIIRTSNLCTEILQYTSRAHTAVCTLASIAVARFVRSDKTYDFDALHATARIALMSTDALLDRARYPTDPCKASVDTTRAVAVGVQGLADAFMQCGFPFDSPDARRLNREIFQTIYHATHEASVDLAARLGHYPLYPDSAASNGLLQHDMWKNAAYSSRYDLEALRDRILQHGLRNSMLTAQMPTASTAKLLGNFDGTEPYTSNLITHRLLSGDYTEICPWLVTELTERGLWNEDIRTAILTNHGSIQTIPDIPEDVKDIFRTSWEIDPRSIIEMAAERGPFLDQSQSMSLSIASPTPDLLSELQIYAWSLGLKTGLYYLRTQAPTYPVPFGVTPLPNPNRAATVATEQSTKAPPKDPSPPVSCEACSA